jgi:hypothetical protein
MWHKKQYYYCVERVDTKLSQLEVLESEIKQLNGGENTINDKIVISTISYLESFHLYVVVVVAISCCCAALGREGATSPPLLLTARRARPRGPQGGAAHGLAPSRAPCGGGPLYSHVQEHEVGALAPAVGEVRHPSWPREEPVRWWREWGRRWQRTGPRWPGTEKVTSMDDLIGEQTEKMGTGQTVTDS